MSPEDKISYVGGEPQLIRSNNIHKLLEDMMRRDLLLRVFNVSSASDQIPKIMLGAENLREALSEYRQGGDMTESQTLAYISGIGRDVSNNRGPRYDTRRKNSWNQAYRQTINPLTDKAARLSSSTTRPPALAKRDLEHIALHAGQAAAWEEISGIPKLRGKRNVYREFLVLYRNGTLRDWFRDVIQPDGTTEERLIMHMLVEDASSNIQLGCIVDGDESLYYIHPWETTCQSATPIKIDAPIRQIK